MDETDAEIASVCCPVRGSFVETSCLVGSQADGAKEWA